MLSRVVGVSTSNAEVLNISKHGLWLLVAEHEYFLPFAEYPWFREAKIDHVLRVETPRPHHLHWPLLDVDLELDTLASPEKYPLIFQ